MKKHTTIQVLAYSAGLILELGCGNQASQDDEKEQLRFFKASVDGVTGEPHLSAARYTVREAASEPGGMVRSIGFEALSSEPGSVAGSLKELGLSVYFEPNSALTGQFNLQGDSQMRFVIDNLELSAFQGDVTISKLDSQLEGTFNVKPDSSDGRVLTGKFSGPTYYECWIQAPSGTNGITSADGSPIDIQDRELTSEFCKKNRLPGT